MDVGEHGYDSDYFAYDLIKMQEQLYYYALQLTEDREDALAVSTLMKLGRARAEEGNIFLISDPREESVFEEGEEIKGAWVASPIQVFFDLHGPMGGDQEIIQRLLDELILADWKKQSLKGE